MVVGIDVTHPLPGSSPLAPSVAGMVASIDRWLSQWPAVLSIQSERRQEMVSHRPLGQVAAPILAVTQGGRNWLLEAENSGFWMLALEITTCMWWGQVGSAPKKYLVPCCVRVRRTAGKHHAMGRQLERTQKNSSVRKTSVVKEPSWR